MLKRVSPLTYLALLLGINLLLHLADFRKELMGFHVWRQTQTQSTILNYVEEDMNLLHPRRNERGTGSGILRMEFPLMQWLVAVSYKAFGTHLWLTRLWMFFWACWAVVGMYYLIFYLFKERWLAQISAFAFQFSPAFFYYSVTPLPDVMALAMGMCGLALFLKWDNSHKTKHLIASALFLSLATLIKLPFVLFYALPLGWLLQNVWQEGIKKQVLQLFVVLLSVLPPTCWYLTVIPEWKGNIIVKGVMEQGYTLADLLPYWFHVLVSVLPELLLNYGAAPLFLAGLYFIFRHKSYLHPRFGAWLLFGIGLLAFYLYESGPIGTAHDYYLFPFFPVLFVIVVYGVRELAKLNTKFSYLTYILLAIIPVLCLIRNHNRISPERAGFNPDLLTFKQELRAAVPDTDLVVVGPDISRAIFFYYLHKKGWNFAEGELNPAYLEAMIQQGAKYIYTDTATLQSQAYIRQHTDSLVMRKGSIVVYSLKKEKGK